MHKFFIRSVILLSLLPFPAIRAQRPVVLARQPVSYSIPFKPAGGKEAGYGNLILREMAKEVLKEPWLVEIRVNGQLEITAEKGNDGLLLACSFVQRRITGDTLFRRFPVHGVLQPARIGMTLRWANRADTSAFTEQTLPLFPLPEEDSIIFRFPVQWFDQQVDTLLVREIRFGYDSAAVETFLERILLIHDYYASLSLLDTLVRHGHGMSTADESRLPVYALKAWERSVVLNRIAHRSFEGTLLSGGPDPGGYAPKYRQVYRESKTLVYNLIDAVEASGRVNWNGDAAELAGFLTGRVLSYVRMSNQMDQRQGMIFRDCLDHAFDGEAAPPGPEIFRRLLSLMYPGASSDTLPRYFGAVVLESYRRVAGSLIARQEYADAWSLLENGRRFAALFPGIPAQQNDDLLSVAAEGVFNSFTGIATTCLERRQYEMADRYLAKAAQYAAERPGFIRSDSAYRAVFGQLFFMRNSDCDRLLEEKSYADALSCLRELEQRYRPEDLLPVRDGLGARMARASLGLAEQSLGQAVLALQSGKTDSALHSYDRALSLRLISSYHTPVDDQLHALVPEMSRIRSGQLAREGAEALEKRRYTLAVGRFREARALATEAGFDPGRSFDSTYREAMKMYLVVRLYSARKAIWVNRFDSAELALKATEQAAFDFGLREDPVLRSAMEQYRDRMREQQCGNLRDSADLRMIRAGRAAALGNFTGARRYLQEGIRFLQSRPECPNHEKPFLDSLGKINPAADWQQEVKQVAALASAGSYAEALRRFDANDSVFRHHRLERFGLRSTPMPEFLAERQNPHLTWEAARLTHRQERDTSALRFVRLAWEQGYPARPAEHLLKDLGTALARSDRRTSSVADSALTPDRYVPGDPWFDAFRKSYMKEFARPFNTK